MTDFNVGDKVTRHDEGVVTKVSGDYIDVKFDKAGEWTFCPAEADDVADLTITERAPQWLDGDVAVVLDEGEVMFTRFRAGGRWVDEEGTTSGGGLEDEYILVLRDGKPVQ